MKKFLLILIIIFINQACGKTDEIFEFYDYDLKLKTPLNWKLVKDENIKQLKSPDGKIVLSLTLYKNPGGNTKEFIDYRFSAVEKKIWKQVDKKIEFRSKYPFKYKVYEHINDDFYYITIPMVNKADNYFLSSSYVIDKDALEKNIDILVSIIESIEIQKKF